ncbi:galactosylgalactosylxylosylprotein 3-beta-glucuronosyltransferase P-like [Penaeus japonicus]|uniref:galactosylgalactosylxylosylprotein 3-beta-glucuronosyltransferase P-like n=1 Tax=Penaeus japonicus TaxID=27405 RepID=UPI001C7176BE|nr:galactosylgalactosylxylosylprotein 3-beta-glucuronosyltransferase P-like [Penaeus japonicus]
MWCSRATWRPSTQTIWLVAVLSSVITVVHFLAQSDRPPAPAMGAYKGRLHLKAMKRIVNHKLPTIYVITATYKRPEQMAELTRLGQTLLNVAEIHWFIGDDSKVTNERVLDLLEFLGIPYTYLLTPMPEKYKVAVDKAKGVTRKKTSLLPRGVANRMAGLAWVKEHASSGVVYFADDDNTYDIRLFEEMRYSQGVSMWPVGLMARTGVSTPIIKEGKFAGWYDSFISNRKFPVDMAGFAVSVELLRKAGFAGLDAHLLLVVMPFKVGYEETGFLESLGIGVEDIEFKADNCSKIYVWHTQTVEIVLGKRRSILKSMDGTNLRILLESAGLTGP